MRLPHRLQGQKVKSQGHGAGAYCGGHLAAQLVSWVWMYSCTQMGCVKLGRINYDNEANSQEVLFWRHIHYEDDITIEHAIQSNTKKLSQACTEFLQL